MESTQAVKAFCCMEHSRWHAVGPSDGGEREEVASILDLGFYLVCLVTSLEREMMFMVLGEMCDV